MPVDKTTKHILLFGAGKSATVLIDYLKNLSAKEGYKITIADNNLRSVQKKWASKKMFLQLLLM